MKKSIFALTVVVAVAFAGSAFARGGMGMGPGGCGGPGACGPGMGNPAYAQGPYAEQHKKFIAETLPIREEMHAKQIEIQKEYIKDKPDTAKITKLQGEVLQLRQKVYEARAKSGLPMGKMGGKGMRGGRGMGMGPMQQQMPTPATPPAN